MPRLGLGFLCLISLSAGLSFGEDLAAIRKDIELFKTDPRGPYRAIRWFCPDGSVIPPDERCSDPGGLQHAVPKDRVRAIADAHHIYLGQILAGTEFETFLDSGARHARMKQYQMEKFLQASDGGWILRRARYYRGAVQAEDEEAWGQKFLNWLVSRDELLIEQFFLVREIARVISHSANVGRAIRIRALARDIAGAYPPFMDIRIKIHGQPDATDLERVRQFRREHDSVVTPAVGAQLHSLASDLEASYRRANLAGLERYLELVPVSTPSGLHLTKLLGSASPMSTASVHPELAAEQSIDLAQLLWLIRQDINLVGANRRLALIDLSIDVESALFHRVGQWQPRTVGQLLEKNHVLAKAAAGCGFIELWEWDQLGPRLVRRPTRRKVARRDLVESVAAAQRGVAWSVQMMEATYGSVVERFSAFEPLARGLIDDRIRSSILLRYGEAADQLFDVEAVSSVLDHRLLGLRNEGQIRGLNPGVAVGELEVLPASPEGGELLPDKIYVLFRAPEDLRPVAGIATVSEGNAVSHVQLLARNLGIPNASLSRQNLQDLLPYSGTRVFYAVSPRGTVVMKPASEMTAEERILVESTHAPDRKLTLPADRLDLEQEDLLDLSALRASDAGIVCGPKAANLGQLSALFPDEVPPGLVIPFGVFRRHLEQTVPGSNETYWEQIRKLSSRQHGADTPAFRTRREEIQRQLRNIDLLPDFVEKLEARFLEVFQVPVGELRVFVRSDTNMEDLESFTGAGLNLTVANVSGKLELMQAIRDVWASPFSEKSYQWRQRVLTNPDAVYPSVILIPSVSVEKSGVLITSGVSSRDRNDLTVAFNWGGAGAVGGQSAETYLLRSDGTDVLLSPSREPSYNALSDEGGIEMVATTFHRPILSALDRSRIRRMAAELHRRFREAPGMRYEGPFDVELGFSGDSIWLFQVRPFVENHDARSSSYLARLDPPFPESQVSRDEPLPARPRYH